MDYEIIGAGNYGIVVRSGPHTVWKLFKSLGSRKDIQREAEIQETVRNLFQDTLQEIKVPTIHQVSNTIVTLSNQPYLQGIEMEYVQPPKGYSTQVHTCLGYHEDDIDTIWGMRIADPVSSTNPPRGFFASPTTLEELWKEEGSDMTIETLAYTMGKAHRIILANGILPIDLEWVWSNGSLWAIDFGLCEFGKADPTAFLNSHTSFGLQNDFYIPHEGDRGYQAFLRGYFESSC